MNEIDFLVAKSLRQLSSLVVEKVFGNNEVVRWECDAWDCAEDLNDTYRLLEYLRSKKGIQLRITPIGFNGGWQCDRVDPSAASHLVVAQGNTIPVAVCLAALRACGYSAVLDLAKSEAFGKLR